ncbi:MAG: helix-turn-helix transcriptional regulator [Clostridia bacterium]|nr:helix-turn-helix transcriptional regulator [Clostridia bacterium]MEE1126165.1 AraC family transcriptional regulator [Acutalibacteraceae bacterium]
MDLYTDSTNKKPPVTEVLEEKIDTENFGMPIRYYYVNTSDEDELSMYAHWHNEIEIQLFVKGTSTTTIDNTEVFIGEGDILFIPSQSIHFGQAETPEIEMHTVIFHAELLCPMNREESVQKYLKPFINRTAIVPYVVRTTDEGYNEIKNCIMQIANLASEKPPLNQLKIMKSLYALFIKLYEYDYVKIKTHSTVADKNYLAVRDAIAFIEENYAQPLTVDDLAFNAGFSKSRFMTIFKEYTNTTCKKFINQCRLDASKEMLKETNETVLNIAIACGYNNISLFNREFKKAYNITPLEYRKSNR